MSSYKIFALKLAIFSATLAYLAGDLFLWQGPAWRALHGSQRIAAEAPPAAVVYGERITPGQLSRYAAESNWLRGRTENTQTERSAMLMDMVRGCILSLRTRYNDKNLPDCGEEARSEVARLATRARSDEDFDAWLASQGYTREEYTKRMQAGMKATALLERAVSPHCVVTDEDVARHYELMKDELMAPAHRPLRHIFFSTLGQEPAAVQQRAQALLAEIEAGGDFAELARRHSEDGRTAAQGGDLGEVQQDSYFPLPELPLFGEGALPAGRPALAQSRWGWHILLPGEITPARQLTLDECRESLRTAIQSAQYELGTNSWFSEAIQDAFRKKHLQIYGN